MIIYFYFLIYDLKCVFLIDICTESAWFSNTGCPKKMQPVGRDFISEGVSCLGGISPHRDIISSDTCDTLYKAILLSVGSIFDCHSTHWHYLGLRKEWSSKALHTCAVLSIQRSCPS